MRSIVQLLMMSAQLSQLSYAQQEVDSSTSNLPPGFDFQDGQDEFVTVDGLQIGSCYQFEPFAKDGFFIMNAKTDGEMRAYVTSSQLDATVWKVSKGLIGTLETYSFESVVAKDHFLTYSGEQ